MRRVPHTLRLQADEEPMKDPTDTRDIGPRVGSPLWIHITIVIALGTAVFAYMISYLRDSGLTRLTGHPLFWILADHDPRAAKHRRSDCLDHL
jgi:hypothetical protein